MKGWFYNSDGFGGEPIPGFEKVVTPPDTSGTGTYLICDVNGPGAILRLWTAGINGRIRLFLDNQQKPVYDGAAEEFFWNTAAKISGINNELTCPDIYRQFDATYFPIPFSQKCRIEWTGNIKKIHFYHVGVRLYDEDAEVETFQPGDLSIYAKKLKNLKNNFHSKANINDQIPISVDSLNLAIPGNTSVELLHSEGPRAVDYFSVKVDAKDLESALRTNILSIYFDDADKPQIHAPVGDFFGAAPGLNPYVSFPYSIHPDGSMISRFVMPYKKSVKMEIENMSGEPVNISGKVHYKSYTWIEGQSMHFRANWKINHGLTASNSSIVDIPYFIARGKGRIVGVAAFIYNPSDAVISWGNWWGEGDEKIFIDDDTFPSFFGTGSEDYFNYSWSAEHFFSFPYCGQPRNDGPGNRGYVSNFRWHISDDLIFNKSIAFYMELFHHGVVPDFSYGRIVYSYALPGCIDDFIPITERDAKTISYLDWKPLAYLGSSGYTFIQSENIIVDSISERIVAGKLWSGGQIILWEPGTGNESLSFIIDNPKDNKSNFGITLAHMPQGGEITVLLNGEAVKFNNSETIDLHDSTRTFLRNYLSSAVSLNTGKNDVTLIYQGKEEGKKIGIDFFWLKDK
jgi:hypothetical protein